MSDWLSGGDDNSGGDGYLGLDDPAMPDTAPAPPTAPQAAAGGDDWLTGAATPEPGHQAGAAPVADSQGDWFGTGGDDPMSGTMGGNDPYAAQTQGAPAATMAPPMPQTYAQDNTPAPMPMAQNFGGDLQVTSPQLQQVQPSPRSLGGAKGQLSNLVLDVEVEVEVGLGSASLTVEEFLEMGRGSVVELDTPVDAPILLKVRNKLIARGQLVSINGAYGMRIVEMVSDNED